MSFFQPSGQENSRHVDESDILDSCRLVDVPPTNLFRSEDPEMNFARRWSVAAVLLSSMAMLLAPVLEACPFCSAPSLTLSEQVAQSDAVVLVHWSGGKEAKGQDGGSTEYTVVDVVSQPKGGKLAKGQKISLVRYRAGKTSDQFLLLGTKGGAVMDWGSPMEVTNESYQYIRNAPKPDLAPSERIRYFVKYLENPDQNISNDAYAEFANTAYGDIVKIVPDMPHDKLQKWINDPAVSPSRLGLYGLMLGLCGTDKDVPLLEKKILEPSEEFRLGIDGIMGGYLLLTGEQGLQVIDQHKLADKEVPFSETYAGMQALRFMWQYGDGKIPADRLKASMRLLLDRPELADLVIADLARWKDWSVQGKLMEIYGQDEYNIPSIKRAIVRFMMASTKDVAATKDGEPAAALPDYAVRGAKYLEELEAKDPKTVAEAKRFFFIK